MPPITTPQDKAALRGQHRAARALRIRQIRRRVAATGVALFIAAWGVVYTQGSTGATTASPSTAVAARVSTTSASTTGNSTSSQASAVTTQQS